MCSCEWTLYGKYKSERKISEEVLGVLRDRLEDFSDDWDADCDPPANYIFRTDYGEAYSDVRKAVMEFSKFNPDFIFRLDCHNYDYDTYRRIHIWNGECEEMGGHVAYQSPQRIFYDEQK